VAVGAKQLQAIALTSDAPIQWLTAIVPPADARCTTRIGTM
jgi:hypothetical protein